MLLTILHLHLPVPKAFTLLLRFRRIGRMHERGAADTVADRCAVQKKHTAFPHSANVKIGIFHQPDLTDQSLPAVRRIGAGRPTNYKLEVPYRITYAQQTQTGIQICRLC